MKLPAMNLEAIRTIPLMQKIAFVVLILAGIIVMFYYYVVEPKSMEIANLQGEIGKLDTEDLVALRNELLRRTSKPRG